MRPKILLVVVVPALIVVLAVLWKLNSGDPAKNAGAGSESTAAGQPGAGLAAADRLPELPPLPPLPATSTPAPAALTEEEKQSAIAAELRLLAEAYSNPGSNSAALILRDLTNAAPEIRAAAAEAAKQLGDRSLIPQLTNLAATVENYDERHALQGAADFLALPSFAEAEKSLVGGGTTVPRVAQGTDPSRRPAPVRSNRKALKNPPPVADPNALPPGAPPADPSPAPPEAVPNQ